MYEKNAFIDIDINTVIIIIEKNAPEFKVFQFKMFVYIRLPLVT